MSASYVIAMAGIEDLLNKTDGPTFEAGVIKAARLAINKTADHSRSYAADVMMRNVNFPSSFLRGNQSKLTVSQKASDGNLEAIITGRSTPTSLARFVSSQASGGLRVSVKRGSSKLIKSAFIMNLRSGATSLNNKGLAVRTDGRKPRGAYKPKEIAPGLWLLYGPSVDQVFKNVRSEITPHIEDYLAAEFNRVWDLDL
jgi:hypothetical protein